MPSPRSGASTSRRPMPDEWRGGLIQNQTDRAGLAYKRNRYYDPSTGRFTQVDPIGIAGGTNVYGFASGDPVNFADPFGLWPAKTHDAIITTALRGAAPGADIWAIMRGSRQFDLGLSQLPRNSFMHSMRATGQNPSAAIAKRDGFIESNMRDAENAQSRGDHQAAMSSLSIAMHTVMDETSPAHVDASGNPLVWRVGDFSEHNKAESGSPTVGQQAAMNSQLRSMYDRVNSKTRRP